MLLTWGVEVEAEYVVDNTVVRYDDSCPITILGTTEHIFGVDGCSAIAEMRIPPEKEYTALWSRMQLEIKKKMKELRSNGINGHYTLLGNEYQIGMHLHVGIEDRHTKMRVKDGKFNLAKALNRYLGWVCFNGNSRTRQTGYGDLKDMDNIIRGQIHGVEYRPLPAWIAADKRAFHVTFEIFSKVVKAFIKGHLQKCDGRTMAKRHEYKRLGINFDDVLYLQKHCRRQKKSSPSRRLGCYS